ncbi:MAG: ABC transporter permease [Rhodoglobus sp.]
MTTATQSDSTLARVPKTTAAHRIGNVVRLHFTNPWTILALPSIILTAIFLLNLAIWVTVYLSAAPDHRSQVSNGLQYTGSSFYIFVYMLVVAVQAISITFPFALGYGVTRRDYYRGTAVTFVILAAIYSAGMTLLSIIEDATGGWGVGGRMFSAVYFGDSWPVRLYVYFVLLLLFFFVGTIFAAVWVRWKATGLATLFIAFGVLAVGLIALIILTSGWGNIAAFFVNAGFVGSASWSLAITAIAGLTGYLVLRRATPRT